MSKVTFWLRNSARPSRPGERYDATNRYAMKQSFDVAKIVRVESVSNVACYLHIEVERDPRDHPLVNLHGNTEMVLVVGTASLIKQHIKQVAMRTGAPTRIKF